MRSGVLELGDVEVERGGVIAGARLAWQTHGTLSPAGDNAIVHPCSYTATHDDLAELIGPDGVLDPERWFVIVPDMFSDGLSSSASDTAGYPPLVTMADNVAAQHRLVTEHLGVTRLAAVYGFSMGAGQAYHWAAMYPEMVERAIVVCGSARTSVHNRVMLSGLLRTLEAAPEHLGGGRFAAQPDAAVRAFAHIYAGWGLSQDFYRQDLHRSALGAPDLDTFLRTDWEESFAGHPAADLYAQARTWQEADISAGARFGGDLPAALRSITARVLLVPSTTDLYFRVEDNAAELEHLAHGALRPIETVWGHRAGWPVGLPEELSQLRGLVGDWLDH